MTARIVDQALESLPAASYLLWLGGQLPPALRSRSSARFLAALARRHCDGDRLVPTNYGIARGLQCFVPSSHFHARFGKPAFYTGERGALELASVLCRSSDAFLDVGAHLGFFTFYVRTTGSATIPIHFFEPDPDLFRLLERNVLGNRLTRVIGHQAAIGAVDGTARFYANRTDCFSGSLTAEFADRHEVAEIEVRVRCFADVARELNLTHACVKVDVEHAEAEFIEGARGALERIAYLIIEILEPAHVRGFVPELMARGGFNAYYINDYTLEHSRDGGFTYRSPEFNWLFCREGPDDLARRLTGTSLRVD